MAHLSRVALPKALRGLVLLDGSRQEPAQIGEKCLTGGATLKMPFNPGALVCRSLTVVIKHQLLLESRASALGYFSAVSHGRYIS
jgi:hypothetical protein